MLFLDAGTYRLSCDNCGPVTLTYGQRAPTEVLPELTIKPGVDRVVLMQDATLFSSPLTQPPGPNLIFNQTYTMAPSGSPAYHVITLPAGVYQTMNRTGRTQHLSPFGPLYERYEK